ncbi:MAG: hypothetical protein U0361_05455 [Nitrospiraceae bacterium]
MSMSVVEFEKLSEAYSQNSLKAMYLWSWYWPGMVFVGSSGTVLILWYGAPGSWPAV